MDLVVGFDLDMTLVDSRPCILAVAKVLAEEEGVFIDAELWASRLGPSLEVELACWFPAEDVDRIAWRYRALLAERTGCAIQSTECVGAFICIWESPGLGIANAQCCGGSASFAE